MPDGIMIGSDCADWWDEQLKNYKAELEAYVLENPSYWGIAVATAKATGADLAHVYFVDLARLGEGAGQGGVKGIVQDLLRVMQFIPAGKVLSASKGFFGRIAQRLSNFLHWRNVKGGTCAPIAIAQALQRSGQKLAVSLREVADAFGMSLDEIAKSGVNPRLVGGALQRLGVEFSTLSRSVTYFDEVVTAARAAEGPLFVTINGMRAGQPVGHAILVGRTTAGISIIDRYGMFRNLDELSRHYNIKFAIDTTNSLYVLKNAIIDESLIRLANQFGIFATLARLSVGVFDFNRSEVDPEFVKNDFMEFVKRRRGSNGAEEGEEIKVVGGKTVNVVAGTTLSGISKAEYGTFDLWTLIFDLNKDTIGPNPNKLKVGQQLLVLPIQRYTPQEIASAKQRAPTWKNYS
jgi:hypothetical protein